jgi:hypothetical protein
MYAVAFVDLLMHHVSEMWKALQLKSTMDVDSSRTRNLLLNVENVNTYFADISFNSQYKEADVGAFRSNVACVDADVQQLFAYEVENMLRRVTKTAPGGDNYLTGCLSSVRTSWLKLLHT